MDNATILAIGKTVMEQSGKIALEYWEKGVEFSTKTAHFDTVTEADKKVEEHLIAFIQKNFPEDSFLAEESGGTPVGNF